MKGFCVDCLYIRQEWTIAVEDPEELVIDTWCDLCNIFKKPDGFCDCWSAK